MAEKLYKRKFTSDDIALLENWVKKVGLSLCIETWENRDGDGVVHDISCPNLTYAISLTDKYYDAVNSNNKSAELVLRDKSGDYTCIYHTHKNCSGITYEALNYAKRC